MQAYDIFMLLVMVGAVAWGFWKGFAWQLASLASIGLSYFISLSFRMPVAGMVAKATNIGPPVNVLLAMLILFLATALAVWVAFNFVSDFIERVRLKEFDHQVGALFGFVKGAVLCVIITLFAVTLLGEARCQAICNSYSGRLIAQVLVQAEQVIPPETMNAVIPHVAPTRAGYPNFTNAPVYNQPTYEQPTYEQPVYRQPVYGQPNPNNSYQPNPSYDPRYGSQPGYEVPSYQR